MENINSFRLFSRKLCHNYKHFTETNFLIHWGWQCTAVPSTVFGLGVRHGGPQYKPNLHNPKIRNSCWCYGIPLFLPSPLVLVYHFLSKFSTPFLIFVHRKLSHRTFCFVNVIKLSCAAGAPTRTIHSLPPWPWVWVFSCFAINREYPKTIIGLCWAFISFRHMARSTKNHTETNGTICGYKRPSWHRPVGRPSLSPPPRRK